MSLQGLYTGLSGLNANQRALDVTSNNIANKDTDGYTKQRVNFTTNPIRDVNNASMVLKSGTGTHIQSVNRIEDTFLYDRLNKAKQDFENNSTQFKVINELNEQLQTEDFSSMYDKMFESMHRYAESPHNLQLKYITEQASIKLKERAEDLQEVFSKSKEVNKLQIKTLNIEIEPMKKDLEKLNLEIEVQESANEFNTDKTYANDMRDKRDLLKTQIFVNEAKVQGFENSNKIIDNVSDLFKDSFSESYSNIEEYLGSEQTGEDANKVIDFEEIIRGRNKEPFVQLKDMERTAEIMKSSSSVVAQSLQNKDDNISKVNLDEEMVNMLKYQKAYEANAIVIRTYDEILKTTLDIKR